MGAYLGMRIIDGAFTYDYVMGKRSDLKADIDAYLIDRGRSDLITQ